MIIPVYTEKSKQVKKGEEKKKKKNPNQAISRPSFVNWTRILWDSYNLSFGDCLS